MPLPAAISLPDPAAVTPMSAETALDDALASLGPKAVNAFAGLPDAFYTRLAPISLHEPELVVASEETLALLGLPASVARTETFVETFAGNRPLPGAAPLAAVYSGHQFGVWAGQLGDGRAHLLGEYAGPAGPQEIQLKGAGKTPYSRMGDGRAVLRSSIREFLCSEAMAALGVPTTRALCVVGSPLPVRRETMETAAVATRVAPSFVRFGSFEHWAARERPDLLAHLVDHVVERHMPALAHAPSRAEAMLREVSRRTGVMLAHWQAVGFMHGVMNTDNMSILGLTLDYGPFGFMEAFDAGHICNHSDEAGRYAYDRQPGIAHWNLYALGSALMPLIEDEARTRAAIEEAYPRAYNTTFESLMRAKLGLLATRDDDGAFIDETFTLLQAHRPDYTSFFRGLSGLAAARTTPEADAAVRDLFIDRAACDAWLARWRSRLTGASADDAVRRAAMRAANPKYVLRNWLAELAIRQAREHDFTEVERVLKCLRRPYDEQPEFEHYAALPPDWASGLEVSCSS